MKKQSEWNVVELGNSFKEYQVIIMKQQLQLLVTEEDKEELDLKAHKMSRILNRHFGHGHWQVFFVSDHHAKIFVSNGNYFAHFKYKTGLQVYLWLNRFEGVQNNQPII